MEEVPWHKAGKTLPRASVTRALSYTHSSWGKFTISLVSLFHHLATLINTRFSNTGANLCRKLTGGFLPHDHKPAEQVTADLFMIDLAILEAIRVDHLLFFGWGGGKKFGSSSCFPHRSLLNLFMFLLLHSGPSLIYLQLCHSAGKRLSSGLEPGSHWKGASSLPCHSWKEFALLCLCFFLMKKIIIQTSVHWPNS